MKKNRIVTARLDAQTYMALLTQCAIRDVAVSEAVRRLIEASVTNERAE